MWWWRPQGRLTTGRLVVFESICFSSVKSKSMHTLQKSGGESQINYKLVPAYLRLTDFWVRLSLGGFFSEFCSRCVMVIICLCSYDCSSLSWSGGWAVAGSPPLLPLVRAVLHIASNLIKRHYEGKDNFVSITNSGRRKSGHRSGNSGSCRTIEIVV